MTAINDFENRARERKVRSLVIVLDAQLKAFGFHPHSVAAIGIIDNLTEANWRQAESAAKIAETSPTTREHLRAAYRKRIAELGKGSLVPVTDEEMARLTKAGISLDVCPKCAGATGIRASYFDEEGRVDEPCVNCEGRGCLTITGEVVTHVLNGERA